jgi:hypothetical protein
MADRPSRLRSLFQNFYGIGVQDEKAKAALDKTNIDGAAYDAHDAFLAFVRKESLQSLRSKDASLQAGLSFFQMYFIFAHVFLRVFASRDIRRLDSRLQSLVYENYSKFIVAGDTIHQMKAHVTDMEQQMETLTLNVRNIHISSGLVDVHLGDRREKLERLTSINTLLTKVS